MHMRLRKQTCTCAACDSLETWKNKIGLRSIKIRKDKGKVAPKSSQNKEKDLKTTDGRSTKVSPSHNSPSAMMHVRPALDAVRSGGERSLCACLSVCVHTCSGAHA